METIKTQHKELQILMLYKIIHRFVELPLPGYIIPAPHAYVPEETALNLLLSIARFVHIQLLSVTQSLSGTNCLIMLSTLLII